LARHGPSRPFCQLLALAERWRVDLSHINVWGGVETAARVRSRIGERLLGTPLITIVSEGSTGRAAKGRSLGNCAAPPASSGYGATRLGAKRRASFCDQCTISLPRASRRPISERLRRSSTIYHNLRNPARRWGRALWIPCQSVERNRLRSFPTCRIGASCSSTTGRQRSALRRSEGGAVRPIFRGPAHRLQQPVEIVLIIEGAGMHVSHPAHGSRLARRSRPIDFGSLTAQARTMAPPLAFGSMGCVPEMCRSRFAKLLVLGAHPDDRACCRPHQVRFLLWRISPNS